MFKTETEKFDGVITRSVNVCRKMSAEEHSRTRAGGGRTARAFTAREDLVQALVSLGVTRNAATRVLKLYVNCCGYFVPYSI